ncbi:hypothetical protein [Flindersiella endophytica]
MKRRQFAALPAALLLQPGLPGLRSEAAALAPEEPIAVDAEAGSFESPAVVEGNLPVFFEQLKDELTFPLAWGTSPERDFRRWRGQARAKVEELLWQPVDRSPFDVEIDDEQPGPGYVQR